jgi:tripartite-type tricarboxylate transporter receptor subunit TctC
MNQKIISGFIAALSIFSAGITCAEVFPDHPVKIIVPYSAGGTADYSARQIAQK